MGNQYQARRFLVKSHWEFLLAPSLPFILTNRTKRNSLQTDQAEDTGIRKAVGNEEYKSSTTSKMVYLEK